MVWSLAPCRSEVSYFLLFSVMELFISQKQIGSQTCVISEKAGSVVRYDHPMTSANAPSVRYRRDENTIFYVTPYKEVTRSKMWRPGKQSERKLIFCSVSCKPTSWNIELGNEAWHHLTIDLSADSSLHSELSLFPDALQCLRSDISQSEKSISDSTNNSTVTDKREAIELKNLGREVYIMQYFYTINISKKTRLFCSGDMSVTIRRDVSPIDRDMSIIDSRLVLEHKDVEIHPKDRLQVSQKCKKSVNLTKPFQFMNVTEELCPYGNKFVEYGGIEEGVHIKNRKTVVYFKFKTDYFVAESYRAFGGFEPKFSYVVKTEQRTTTFVKYQAGNLWIIKNDSDSRKIDSDNQTMDAYHNYSPVNGEGANLVAQANERKTAAALEFRSTYIIVDTKSAPLIAPEVSWSHETTLLVIDSYRQLRNKVGSLQIKNMNKLWEVIAEKMNSTFGCNFTFYQVENRWRVLESWDLKVIQAVAVYESEASGHFTLIRKNSYSKTKMAVALLFEDKCLKVFLTQDNYLSVKRVCKNQSGTLTIDNSVTGRVFDGPYLIVPYIALIDAEDTKYLGLKL
nr:unnamed protein product [Callosobruchus analis]